MKFLEKPLNETLLNNLIFKIYKKIGWKISECVPKGAYVFISEHTSNWDAFHAFFYYKILDLNGYLAVAEEKTKFLPKWLVKKFRILAIPRNSEGMKILTDEIKKEKKSLYIAPEGTRSLTDGWKPGFHVIARKFNIPIVVVGVDYKNKELLTLGLVNAGNSLEETVERCVNVLNQYPHVLPLHKRNQSPRQVDPKYKKY